MPQHTSSLLQLESDLHSWSAFPGSVQTDSGEASVVRKHASPSAVLQSLSALQKRGQSFASAQALPSPKSQHSCPLEVSHSLSEPHSFRHSSAQTPTPDAWLPVLGLLLLLLEQPGTSVTDPQRANAKSDDTAKVARFIAVNPSRFGKLSQLEETRSATLGRQAQEPA